MKKKNWSAKEALSFLKKKRKIVNPNRTFMKELLEYEQILKNNQIIPEDQKESGQKSSE